MSCRNSRRWRTMSSNPGMHKKKQDLLRRAVQLFGKRELAARLHIPETLLDAWVRGDVTMPDGQLLTLAAVLDKLAKPKE